MINRLLIFCLFVFFACRPYKDTGHRASFSEKELGIIDQARPINGIAELPRRIRDCRFFKNCHITNDSSAWMRADGSPHLFVSGAYRAQSKCGYVLLRQHPSGDGDDLQCVLFHAQGDSINIDRYYFPLGIRTWSDTRPALSSAKKALFWGYIATEKEARKMQRKAKSGKH